MLKASLKDSFFGIGFFCSFFGDFLVWDLTPTFIYDTVGRVGV